jgi:hypothetical protein
MAARSRRSVTLEAVTAFALAVAPLAASAAPPAAGTTHTFRDPIFNGTVVCDTLDQVWDIATSDEPDDVYGLYRITANEMDEPTCMAIVPTGTVIDVTPIGVMEKGGDSYNAWAVETDINGVIVYVLYLERAAGLSA